MLPSPGVQRLKFVEPTNLIRFYFICTGDGLAGAVRKMYECTGDRYDVTTFRRALDYLREETQQDLITLNPFEFLPLGREVYEVSKRQFELAGPGWTRLLHRPRADLRLGAGEHACREYLPAVVDRMESRHGISVELVPGSESEIDRHLRDGVIEIGITSLSGRQIPDTENFHLVDVPLVILVPRRPKEPNLTPITSVDHFLSQNPVKEILICSALEHGVCRMFNEGLTIMGVRWPNLQHVNSTALVTTMVAHCGRPGLSILLPRMIEHPNVCVLPLLGFPPVPFGAIWRKPTTPALTQLLAMLKASASDLRATLEPRRSLR